uniref:Uncharacterized protein n=1 Tax=Araucaria cunninghamii TaxID=56994 RepID=A0A0D6QU11_ARACU
MRLGIDEEEWLIQVKDEALSLGEEMGDPVTPCIFCVPKTLVNENEAAYIPEIVSLGPFHCGKPELRGMEKYKAEAARRVSCRIQSSFPDKNFTDVVNSIMSMEHRIRACYDKEIHCSGEVLCWMMARDASFLLEFFRNYNRPFQQEDREKDAAGSEYSHPVFCADGDNSTVLAIIKDIMKLENQIPLFVLEQVLAVEMDSIKLAREQMEVILKLLFDNIYRPFNFFIFSTSPRRSHVLEMYHYSCFGKNSPMESSQDSWNPWPKALDDHRLKIPSAVKLTNAGVMFKANAGVLEEIKFDKETCVLSLPLIILNVESEVFIRNLIALELCSPQYKIKKFTQYAQFMDDLIHNKKGVSVMRDKGVIVGNLRRYTQLARLWNSSNLSPALSQCVAIAETRKNIHEYYSKKWRIHYKTLWNEFWKAYVSKPWLVMGGVGAIIVLILTVLQVVCLFYPCTPT